MMILWLWSFLSLCCVYMVGVVDVVVVVFKYMVVDMVGVV